MTPGALVGKYRLSHPLGRGAMGEVWAAVNVDTDRSVALKLITSPDPELRRRLLREARAIGRLDHPNIVQILDRGETQQGEPFLVMQLLQGETLDDRLRREGALPEPIAAGIALDVARALRAAHEKEIVHRDLKPANIFLHREPDTDEDVVKVVDFGVSQLSIDNEGANTVQGGLLGSPAYMSPEQIRSSGVDGRTDVWAVGVVLHEMLTGERPFNGASSVAVLGRILDPDYFPPAAAGVSRELSDVVAACLERDLARRLPSVTELARRLRPFVKRGRYLTIESADAAPRLSTVPESPPASAQPRPPAGEVSDEESTALFRPSMLLGALADEASTLLVGQPAAAELPLDEISTNIRPLAPMAGPLAAPGAPPPPAGLPSSPNLAPAAQRRGRGLTERMKPMTGPPAQRAPAPRAPLAPPAPPPAPPLAAPPPPPWAAAPLAAPPLAAPPAPAPAPLFELDLRHETAKLDPGMLAQSPAAAWNRPREPALSSPGTTSTAPLTTPAPLPATGPAPLLAAAPAVLVYQPPPWRRWPFMVLVASLFTLFAAGSVLLLTLTSARRGGPGPAAQPTVIESASTSTPEAPSPASTTAPSASASAPSSAPPRPSPARK